MKKLFAVLIAFAPIYLMAQRQGGLPFDCRECFEYEAQTMNTWLGKYSYQLFTQLGMPSDVRGDSIVGYILEYEMKSTYTITHEINGTTSSDYIIWNGKKYVFVNRSSNTTISYDTEKSFIRLLIGYTNKDGFVYKWETKTKNY